MHDSDSKKHNVVGRFFAGVGHSVRQILDDLKIIFKHISLFLGMAIALIGIFSFKSGRYCDGNTADFYSCTRPSTYYYYSEWSIVLIVAGVFLIGAWVLTQKKSKRN